MGLAAKKGVPVEKIQRRVKELHEFNPMLGFHGCRLGIVYPEISEMQARAVFEAAAEVQKSGIKVKPEVMIRDDSGSFLPPYTEAEIVKKNPFASINQTGVGQLVKIAVEKGNATRPGIKLGICGEHGGDPDSVKFCHKVGLTYVSCSPFRVPVARLAAAQAAIADKQVAVKKPAKKK